MGTVCAVSATAARSDAILAKRALDAARREVAACERALSRFDPGSDLSRLNRANGSWIEVDTRLCEALSAALRARVETHGRFDPTILPALAAAGYDRSFEQLTERPAVPVGGWHAGARIDVDPGARRARIERTAAVDLGGIGKGFASTRALHAMRSTWPGMAGAIVDLGGDIAVWGTPPEGGRWRVDIADPRTRACVAGTLALESGGVATSGRDTRRFGPGRRLHHLIDPATGAPAVAGPLSATVAAGSAIEAEAFATALAVTDVGDARDQIGSRSDLGALLIPHSGEAIVVGRLPLVQEPPRPRFVITTQTGRFPWQ
jgi:thiamine biosynthesis lipoprotein